jgi:hypothetical protein
MSYLTDLFPYPHPRQSEPVKRSLDKISEINHLRNKKVETAEEPKLKIQTPQQRSGNSAPTAIIQNLSPELKSLDAQPLAPHTFFGLKGPRQNQDELIPPGQFKVIFVLDQIKEAKNASMGEHGIPQEMLNLVLTQGVAREEILLLNIKRENQEQLKELCQKINKTSFWIFCGSQVAKNFYQKDDHFITYQGKIEKHQIEWDQLAQNLTVQSTSIFHPNFWMLKSELFQKSLNSVKELLGQNE